MVHNFNDMQNVDLYDKKLPEVYVEVQNCDRDWQGDKDHCE